MSARGDQPCWCGGWYRAGDDECDRCGSPHADSPAGRALLGDLCADHEALVLIERRGLVDRRVDEYGHSHIVLSRWGRLVASRLKRNCASAHGDRS